MIKLTDRWSTDKVISELNNIARFGSLPDSRVAFIAAQYLRRWRAAARAEAKRNHPKESMGR